MIFARVAVVGAILCTLWFNGSYAWHKGGALPQQLAMVALALTIDAAKCGFLAGASTLWRHGWRFPPILLVLLWVPCLAYSTFAAYASLTTNREAAGVTERQVATGYATAEQTRQAASAAFATARASPEWNATAACTNPRNQRQRTYCGNMAKLTKDLASATAALTAKKPVTADPEITALAVVFGLAPATVLFTIAFWPALLLELTASLGFYVVNRPLSVNQPVNAPQDAPQPFSAPPADTAVNIIPKLPTAPGEAPARLSVRWSPVRT